MNEHIKMNVPIRHVLPALYPEEAALNERPRKVQPYREAREHLPRWIAAVIPSHLRFSLDHSIFHVKQPWALLSFHNLLNLLKPEQPKHRVCSFPAVEKTLTNLSRLLLKGQWVKGRSNSVPESPPFLLYLSARQWKPEHRDLKEYKVQWNPAWQFAWLDLP